MAFELDLFICIAWCARARGEQHRHFVLAVNRELSSQHGQFFVYKDFYDDFYNT